LISPSSLSVDAACDLYIADAGANFVYAVYSSTTSSGSNIAVVFGTGIAGHQGDGGFSTLAQVSAPASVAVDGNSNLFVVDSGNNSIREITYPNPALTFGTITVSQTSAAVRQNLSNFGNSSLSATSPFSISDSHFTIDGNSTSCGTAVIAGSTCTIGFVFAPTANGLVSATATLSSNSYNSPQAIALAGTGHLIAPLQFTLPAQTEVYGQPFPETVETTSSNPAPTGTITFSLGKTVLCSLAATLGPTTTCNAPNSGLSVGTYAVTFSYTGDSNYSPASGILTLTVTTAALTVTVDNASRQYGGPNPTFTGTLSGVIPGDTVLVAYSTTATVNSSVGTYPITATITAAGSTNLGNYAITNNAGTLTITQTPLTITVLDASRQYGQPNPAFTSTTRTTLNGVSISGTLNGDALTINYSTPATVTSPVGTYAISATISGASAGNYLVTAVPGTLTITHAFLTITVGNANRAYGVANPAFTNAVSGALNGDTFTNTYSTPATITSPVGSYPINDSIGGIAAANYNITVVPGTLTITQASIALNVAANNSSRTYGAANPVFSSTITGAFNGDTFTITYATTATASSPVGTYSITPTVSGAAAGNYSLTISNGVLTITPAPLTVTANNASRSYGAANPVFSGTTAGLQNGDTVTTTFTSAAVSNSPIGTYAIVPAVSGAAVSNYSVTAVNGTLTVTQDPSSLVVNVNSAARAYGAPNPAFSGTVTGVLAGDDVVVTYSTTATQTSPAGRYAIGANVSGTSAANYIANIRPGTLAISAVDTVTTITSSGSPASVGANVTFTATLATASGVVSGSVNFSDGSTLLGTATLNASGVATFSTTALTLGNHTITAAFLANTNFNGSSATLTQVMTAPTGSFTISASPATQYIKGAGATVFQVTLTSMGAFAGQINLACSGLPADATCSFGSNPTLTAGGTATVAMTVNTTVADAKLARPALHNIAPANFAQITVAAVFPIELTGLGIFFAGLRRRKRSGPQKLRFLAALLFSFAVLGLTGCGCPPTVFQTYTINISATSVSFTAPAQSTSVILSVGNQ
jgi:hypothetical protein